MNDYSSIIITLYKEKYNHTNTTTEHCFKTFGEFNYMTINNTDPQYRSMWLKTKDISDKLEAGESCHNLYAVEVKNLGDQNFWTKFTMPYLFCSMIQIKEFNGRAQNEILAAINSYLSDCIKNYHITYKIYNSLDNCDFVVFFKTDNYKIGSDTIQEMHKLSTGNSLPLNCYSYSLCGIDMMYYQTQKINDETLSKVMICFVIKDFAKYAKWYKDFEILFPQIKSEYPPTANHHYYYSRLGNEDICINIMRCDSRKLMSALLDKNGILNIENPSFKNSIMKLRIHLDTLSIEPGKEARISTGHIVSSLSQSVFERHLYPPVQKALNEVINAYRYLEEEHFANDIQACIKNILDMLLIKMEEYSQQESNSDAIRQREYTKQQYNNSVIEVIQGIMSIVNGAMHTDRMFFQSPGFNAVLYEAPSKLLVFYNAFVQKIVNYLNDSEKEFKYLLCPDLYLNTEIRKLFDNKAEYPKKRLLKGFIPVKMIFEPGVLMPELAHEVAHCVGDQIRLREKRLKYTSSMIANIFAENLLGWKNDSERIQLEKAFYPLDAETIAGIKERLYKYVNDFLAKKFKKLQSNISHDAEQKKYIYYQIRTRYFFEWTTAVLIHDYREDLFKIVETEIQVTYLKKGISVPDLMTAIHNTTEIMDNNLKLLFNDMGKYINAIHSLTNESFADLVMCNLLGISMENYAKLFYSKNAELYGSSMSSFLKRNRKDATGERIISVILANNATLDNITPKAETKYNQYISTLKIYMNANNNDRKDFTFLPKQVLLTNKKYLKQCLEILNQKDSDQLNQLRDIYKNITSKSVSDSVGDMLKEVYAFRKTFEDAATKSSNEIATSPK